jgi:hypothetical protein
LSDFLAGLADGVTLVDEAEPTRLDRKMGDSSEVAGVIVGEADVEDVIVVESVSVPVVWVRRPSDAREELKLSGPMSSAFFISVGGGRKGS